VDQLLRKFTHCLWEAMTLLQDDLVVIRDFRMEHCFRGCAGERVNGLIVIAGPDKVFAPLAPVLYQSRLQWVQVLDFVRDDYCR
jgi:hypothetical protein